MRRLRAFHSIARCLPVALLLVAATARAKDPAPTGVAPEGYRHQIVAVDAVGLGLIASSMTLSAARGEGNVSNVLMAVGVQTWLIGAPLGHMAHRRFGRAGGSLVLRLVLPFMSGMVAMSLAQCEGWFCEFDYLGPGIAIGAVTASIIDAVFISDERDRDASDEKASRAPRTRAGIALAPRIVATSQSALLGIGGQF